MIAVLKVKFTKAVSLFEQVLHDLLPYPTTRVF